jgi:hypothetical protein
MPPLARALHSDKPGDYLTGLVSVDVAGGNTYRLPAPAPDPEGQFGVDLHINMSTIDVWLGRDNVAYRTCDALLPAKYEDIGGDANLSSTISGFEIVPIPIWQASRAAG